MKLRIRGNSLRLRLSRSDVNRFESEGIVEEEIVFGTRADQRLIYRLKMVDLNDWSADITGAELTVRVPAADADNWIASEETGIGTEKQIDGGQALQILIERDFTCLKPREGEDDRDTFDHPMAPPTC